MGCGAGAPLGKLSQATPGLPEDASPAGPSRPFGSLGSALRTCCACSLVPKSEQSRSPGEGLLAGLGAVPLLAPLPALLVALLFALAAVCRSPRLHLAGLVLGVLYVLGGAF